MKSLKHERNKNFKHKIQFYYKIIKTTSLLDIIEEIINYVLILLKEIDNL